MQAASSLGGNTIGLVVLGIIEAAIAFVVLTNTALPVIGNNRITLIVFILIGFAMCSMGMEIPQYGWSNPFNLVGSVLGVAILAIGMAAIFGARLPFLADERAAIFAITALMIVKIVLAGVRAVVS